MPIKDELLTRPRNKQDNKMQDESMLNWRTVIRCATLVLCVLVLTLGSCMMRQNYLVAQAIKSGANPLMVNCALGGATQSPICTQIAQSMTYDAKAKQPQSSSH